MRDRSWKERACSSVLRELPAPIELQPTRCAKARALRPPVAIPAAWKRAAGPKHAEALLREALASARELSEIWDLAAAMAPKLDRSTLSWWIDQSARVGGRRWPQFTFDVTTRMLSKLEDDESAMLAWDRVVSRYRGQA